MASTSLDAESLVARLWDEARVKEAAGAAIGAFQTRGEPLQHLWELRYLNHNWDFEVPDPAHFGSPKLKGRVKAALGRFLVHFLAKYFADQREFYANIVRVSNAVAHRHDTLVDDLVRLAQTLQNEVEQLSSRDLVYHTLVEERLEQIERALAGGTVKP